MGYYFVTDGRRALLIDEVSPIINKMYVKRDFLLFSLIIYVLDIALHNSLADFKTISLVRDLMFMDESYWYFLLFIDWNYGVYRTVCEINAHILILAAPKSFLNFFSREMH